MLVFSALNGEQVCGMQKDISELLLESDVTGDVEDDDEQEADVEDEEDDE